MDERDAALVLLEGENQHLRDHIGDLNDEINTLNVWARDLEKRLVREQVRHINAGRIIVDDLAELRKQHGVKGRVPQQTTEIET